MLNHRIGGWRDTQSLMDTLHTLFINFKRKNSKYIAEKVEAETHLNQMLKY